MEDSVHLLDEEDRGKQKLQEAEEQEENDFQEVQVELQEEDDPTREAKRRVLIVTNGTRGDVQPFLFALARALLAENLDVAIATHATFEKWVKEKTPETSFFPLKGDPVAVLSSPELKKALFEGGIWETGKVMIEEGKKYVEDNYRLSWEAAKTYKPDLIVSSLTVITELQAVGQKLRRPVVLASTVPIYPTYETAPITISPTPFSLQFMNKFMYWLSFKGMWTFLGAPINKFRKEIGLPSQGAYDLDAAPMLCMYSKEVSPRPKDWPEHVQITGYWVLSDNMEDLYEPPSELAQFLEAGEPPVYLGFGSMPVPDSKELARTFCEVLRKLGKRGILCAGWSDLYDVVAGQMQSSNEHVLFIKEAPHEWLLPKCSMAIHHGGAGTTAANLRAGIPTIIYHLLVDQPYWAQCVSDLGVGPKKHFSLKELNASNLETQIQECYQPEVIKKAQELAQTLHTKEEDGVANTVAWLKQYISLPSHPHNFPPHNGPRDRQLQYLPDNEVTECLKCHETFGLFKRRHHCRLCGGIFCFNCLVHAKIINYSLPQLVCTGCLP